MVDMMYEKCNCQLECCLEKFFETNSNAIMQIGSVYLAIWKQRNMFFCFDPYSRGTEGLLKKMFVLERWIYWFSIGYRCRDGYACVSMHANIHSLVDTVTHNFDSKDAIFNIHALKVCKINRDPVSKGFFLIKGWNNLLAHQVQSQRFPKHIPLDEFPPEEFKAAKMRKSKKAATEKPITVDYSALAMRSLLMGETPDPSIMEVGR